MLYEMEVQRVKEHLRSSILRAELPEGALIREEVLRSETGASVRAVRQALQDLAREGIVVRKRHAGTRVTERLPTISCSVLPAIRSAALISALPASAKKFPYLTRVLEGMRQELAPPGHLLEFFNEGETNGIDDLPALDVPLIKRNTQGAISIEANNAKALNDLVRAGLPLVAVDYSTPDAVFDCVRFDYIHAGCLATTHLLDLGHESICFLGESQSPYSNDPTWQDRITGYYKAMATRPYAKVSVLDIRRSRSLVPKLLPEFHRAKKPTAYVLASASFAEIVLQSFREMDVQCPRDVSISCADSAGHAAMGIQLSTVFTDYHELGRTAVRLLASRLACRPMPAINSIHYGVFVRGDSSVRLLR